MITKRSKKLLFALTALVAVAIPAAASAAPTVAITSPTAGTTVSKAFETMTVTGTASFDAPVATTRNYYLRADACSGTTNRRLETVAGAETIGCGGLTSAQAPLVHDYPALNGVPIQIDPGKAGRVTIVEGAWLAGVGGGIGQEKIDISLTGRTASGQNVTVATGTETQLVTPAQDEVTHVVPFTTANITETLTSLSLRVTISGTVGRSYTSYAGSSFMELPILDAGVVQVSSDSASFSASKTVVAALAGDGTWTAEIVIPSTGSRKVYARAVQGGSTVNATPVSITVVP